MGCSELFRRPRLRRVSCCQTILVTGGTYGRGGDPAYPATVSDFYPDRFEVTVGRFRESVEAYDTWMALGHPATGEGAHAIIGSASGWQDDWGAGDELAGPENSDHVDIIEVQRRTFQRLGPCCSSSDPCSSRARQGAATG
jgi:hypothetical protein